VAEDLLAGRLGDPPAAEAQLQTYAHQIGHRRPPARSPLGMFLRDCVGPMRTRRLIEPFRVRRP
jgi:hypothetical protein